LILAYSKKRNLVLAELWIKKEEKLKEKF